MGISKSFLILHYVPDKDRCLFCGKRLWDIVRTELENYTSDPKDFYYFILIGDPSVYKQCDINNYRDYLERLSKIWGHE